MSSDAQLVLYSSTLKMEAILFVKISNFWITCITSCKVVVFKGIYVGNLLSQKCSVTERARNTATYLINC
jgi:hypothetical protein